MRLKIAVIAVSSLITLTACTSAPRTAAPVSGGGEWHDFHGTWTAAGSRYTMQVGADRRASIANFDGTLLLAGPSRPAVGFRSEAVVLNDTATGLVGRAVWTDERGDQVYSELRGEGVAASNKIVGTFVGGSGRYADATGSYEFSWRFLLETEDGTVQGQSIGLEGRVHVASPVTQQPGGRGS